METLKDEELLKHKIEIMTAIAAAIVSNPTLCSGDISWDNIADDAEIMASKILRKARANS